MLRAQVSPARKEEKKMNDSRRMLWWALPALLLVACIVAPGFAQAQKTTTGIPCSEIASRHLLMQDNLGAGLTLIQCGVAKAAHPGPTADWARTFRRNHPTFWSAIAPALPVATAPRAKTWWRRAPKPAITQ